MNVTRLAAICFTAAITGTVGCAAKSTPTAKVANYGEPMKLTDKEAMPVRLLLADPGKFENQFVRVTGNVSEICEKKGCFLEMTDTVTARKLFVKFTCPIDGERLIPMSAMGKPVTVEGTLKIATITEDQARHYAKDSGTKPEEIAKIVGPQKQITLSSPAASVAGL